MRSAIAVFLENSSARGQGAIIAALLLAPGVFLPSLYRGLSSMIASSQHLACPACGEIFPDGSTWQVILYTGRCPKCREYIVQADTSAPADDIRTPPRP